MRAVVDVVIRFNAMQGRYQLINKFHENHDVETDRLINNMDSHIETSTSRGAS